MKSSFDEEASHSFQFSLKFAESFAEDAVYTLQAKGIVEIDEEKDEIKEVTAIVKKNILLFSMNFIGELTGGAELGIDELILTPGNGSRSLPPMKVMLKEVDEFGWNVFINQ